MNTNVITSDRQIKPNFVPETKNKDYIEQDDTFGSLIEKNRKLVNEQDSLDKIYEEFQTPLFVMILFFLFQLPYFQKVLIRLSPTLFKNDGKLGLAGLLGKTFLFGSAYYSLTKFTKYFSQI